MTPTGTIASVLAGKDRNQRAGPVELWPRGPEHTELT